MVEVRKITKVAGDTPGVSLPKDILEQAGIKIGDYVKVYSDGEGRIVLEVVK